MVENNMPILRIAVFLRWDDHPQYGEWIDPITHMKHPSSTLTPRRWWVPHFGSTLRHANGHHPRCIGSSGCSVAGKHGDAFVDLTTSDETKMGGKEIKDEITPNEFINQHGLFERSIWILRGYWEEQRCENAALEKDENSGNSKHRVLPKSFLQNLMSPQMIFFIFRWY